MLDGEVSPIGVHAQLVIGRRKFGEPLVGCVVGAPQVYLGVDNRTQSVAVWRSELNPDGPCRKAANGSLDIKDEGPHRIVELLVRQCHGQPCLRSGFPQQKRDGFQLAPPVVLVTD